MVAISLKGGEWMLEKIRAGAARVRGFASRHKAGTALTVGSVAALAPMSNVFAATGPTLYANGTMTQYVIPNTGTGVHTLLQSIGNDVGVMLPIGVAIMSIFVGVAVIPKIVYHFF